MASLGVLPRGPGVGSRLRSPGPGRRWGWLGLPDQQQQQREEMNNLGRSRASGLSGRGVPRVRSVVIFTVYLLGWVGLFLCIVIFSPICLFFSRFFFFFFFLLCLCVCVILSFGRAGSRRRGVLACCSFPPKTWAGGRPCGPLGFLGRRSRAWEEIFLIPDTRTGQPEGDRERQRDRGQTPWATAYTHCSPLDPWNL